MAVQQFAPTLSGPVLSTQFWRNLTFLHWPVDPAAVTAMFPPGTGPDTIDGLTYVGLVPFHMHGARPGRWPPVAYFGDFCETNVRLYSVDDAGRHGIVFLTLDAQRLATVLLARLSLGLPYAWSVMSDARSVMSDARPAMSDAGAGVHHYRSRRRWPKYAADGPATSISVRVGAPVEPEPVETWLTSRWGLHTRVAGRTVWVPNQHDPWPLYSADVLTLEENLVSACGVDVDAAARRRALWSPGVRTTFGLPTVVAR